MGERQVIACINYLVAIETALATVKGSMIMLLPMGIHQQKVDAWQK
jgi:hypothetical protein